MKKVSYFYYVRKPNIFTIELLMEFNILFITTILSSNVSFS